MPLISSLSFSHTSTQSSLSSDSLSSNIKLPQFILPSHPNITLEDLRSFPIKLRDVIAWPLFILFHPKIITNYRPITILSHPSKIFESIVLNSILLPLNHILVDEQYGFRPGRSTTTCNLALTSYIVALAILYFLGSTHLSNRHLFVSVLDSSSAAFVPSPGLPQDDIKLNLRINSISDCNLHEQVLNNLVSWGESLGFSLNISKCSAFSFYRSQCHFNFPYVIHNIPIKPPSDSIHDLGFTFTHDLSPTKHIEVICYRALKIFGFVLSSSSEFQLASPLKALYCALVHPFLEYGSVLLDPSTTCASASIERVKRKFLRIAA
ncbi:putative RNA-directed DNA polymerase [Aphis craccivora]|uniref:Putative RNA-directed DNA polymerase n=1 Tax=Aphis craccivora TaxID=307492 RepID=A0A6G0ZBU1_APHCR|nr:putative RNA-directed DNA polymerase [Aphis craccivora]